MMMKKVCISTWYMPYNYGTGLQAVALKLFLENKGYSCIFLEDGRENKACKKNKSIKQKLDKLFDRDIWAKFIYRKMFSQRKIYQDNYARKYTPAYVVKNDEDIKTLNSQYDIFIIGGDQVFNPYYLEDKHLLKFVDRSKLMISYGSSVGTGHIPEDVRPIYEKYLSRLKYISVREEASVKALDFLNKQVSEVLDPTMLVESSIWYDFMADAVVSDKLRSEKYILCYFVGDRKSYWQYVGKMEKNTGYRVIVIPLNASSCRNSYEKLFQVSPKEFLWLINNAQIICTDSFHASVFSILFNKEFYVLKRFADSAKTSQNSRLTNLLHKYDLDERLIDDENVYVRVEIKNYDKVRDILRDEQEKSQKWLLNALHN